MTTIPPPKGAAQRIARNMVHTFSDCEDPAWSAYLQIMRAMNNASTDEWRITYDEAAQIVAAQMV